MNMARMLALTACTASLAAAQQIQVSKTNKTIAITTSDQASAMADIAVVTIGFSGYGKDKDQLYAASSKTSNAVVQALLAMGVSKESIESIAQGIGPINFSSDHDKDHYAEGMRFSFSQSWRVTTTAARAAAVLNVAISKGANQSGAIDWQLSNDNALQAEAAGKALEQPRQIASNMAQGLHAKLGDLIYASNQAPEAEFGRLGGVPGGVLGGVGLLDEKAALPLAISPNRITKSATVYAVFAIE